MAHVKIQFGIERNQYMQFKAWEIDDKTLATFATKATSKKLNELYNRRAKILSDKSLFNQTFKDYIGRKFVINNQVTREEFHEFMEGLDRIFVKPLGLHSGVGTNVLYLKDFQSEDALFDHIKKLSTVLLEECVKQHHLLAKFNESTINTVRVVALHVDGETKLLCSFFRMGRAGEVADNFGNGGILAGVDVETGEVITDGVDANGYTYVEHPDSHIPIRGFKLPNWDMAVETAKKALDVVDSINYVGWDLVIDEDKTVIIEGNSIPGLDAYQTAFAPERIGKQYLFEPYLK